MLNLHVLYRILKMWHENMLRVAFTPCPIQPWKLTQRVVSLTSGRRSLRVITVDHAAPYWASKSKNPRQWTRSIPRTINLRFAWHFANEIDRSTARANSMRVSCAHAPTYAKGLPDRWREPKVERKRVKKRKATKYNQTQEYLYGADVREESASRVFVTSFGLSKVLNFYSTNTIDKTNENNLQK